MKINTKKFILSAIVLLTGAFLGFMLFNKDERVLDPEKYISLALQNTYELVNIPKYDRSWIVDMLNNRHRMSLGISFKDIDISGLALNPQILAIAQLAGLNMDILRDPAHKELLADVSLAVAGALAANAQMYLSNNKIAVKAPQGFDYFITANPQIVAEQWNDSILGTTLPLKSAPDNESIFENYMKLFSTVSWPELKILNDTYTLYKEAEYGYIEESDGVYVYSMKVKSDKFNTWYRSMIGSIEEYELFANFKEYFDQLHSISVYDDLDVTLYVVNDVINRAHISTLLPDDITFEAALELNGEANPFDDVLVKIDMNNPSGSEGLSSGDFNIANAINKYLDIGEMPQNVHIEINHRGDSLNTELFMSEANISLSAGADNTEIDWYYLWDLSGDVLDNFKITASLSQYAAGIFSETGFNVSGSVFENREKPELLSSFSDISCYVSDGENEQRLALALKLNLNASQEDIIYDETDATELTELSPIKLLRIYANFRGDPMLGRYIIPHTTEN